jgi:tripartite-type tricarboxylate transporter receptor subunit TctC
VKTLTEHAMHRLVVCLLMLISAFASPLAIGQEYPNRPITFIYPYAAGSALDSAWRRILEETSKHLGQQIIVDNRPGAGGRIGFNAIVNARADGYTIGQGSNVLSVFQPLIDPVNFGVKVHEHYTPIVLGVEIHLVLVARPNAPFRSVKELVAAGKASPGKQNGGSAGIGTGTHLGLALLNRMAGIDIVHVPYKGNAPALQGLMGGEIDLMFTDVAAVPHVQSGRLIALGVGSTQRWSAFPGVPTIAESGLQGFRNSSWSGVVGPPGLPAPIMRRLNQAFNDALNAPALRSRLEADGWTIIGGAPEAVTARVTEETEVFRPIIRDANIKIQ